MKPKYHFFSVIILFSVSVQQTIFAQTSDLTAEEIFEKVLQYYDPNDVWSDFKGSMHIYTINANNIGEEDLTIDNSEDYYQTTRYQSDGTYSRNVKAGEIYFTDNGKEMGPEEVPEKLKKAPYGLNKWAAMTFREHHTGHFSLPLMLQAAGAKPLAAVSQRTLFGTDCLAIKFSGLPNGFEKGFYYNIPATLYVDPANDYRLHGYYLETGQWKDKKGGVVLFSGELEIDGLKIPARKLYFNAADLSYVFSDVFSIESDPSK